MAKRKPRNKMAKQLDVLYPINVFELGSKNDPCFGKHNDPKAIECKQCGDAEICAIVQSQKQALKRNKIDGKFMDVEEANTPPNKKLIKAQIKKHIIRYLKLNPNRYIGVDMVIEDVIDSMGKDIKKKTVTSVMNRLVEKGKLTYNIQKTKIKI